MKAPGCKDLEGDLVAYHFGAVSAETRSALEQHLLACPACVAAFLALKRDIETAQSAPAPSSALRQRLRQAVAMELGLVPSPRRWSWWERPLAFGFAGVAVLLAMFAASLFGGGPVSMPHTLKDQVQETRQAPLP